MSQGWYEQKSMGGGKEAQKYVTNLRKSWSWEFLVGSQGELVMEGSCDDQEGDTVPGRQLGGLGTDSDVGLERKIAVLRFIRSSG